ncbi:MAG: HD domain-containing protein [Candidatus Nanohaloarchaea archaeon]|nr:HD domain-containing protein [Candidatus Nanohaloarchaea archaeon]
MADTEFLLAALQLKDEDRTGWTMRDVRDPESVAAHSWGVAFLTALLADDDIDRERAVRMALVHDLAEAETGDIPNRAAAEQEKKPVSDEEKAEQERAVMERFAAESGDESLLELWEEYAARETAEARFVKDMDVLDMCLQALFYEENGRYPGDGENEHFEEYDAMDEFFAAGAERLSTDTGQELFEQVRERYREVRGNE